MGVSNSTVTCMEMIATKAMLSLAFDDQRDTNFT